MSNNQNNSEFRCGFVAIVGRPNVGKSTLLNQLLGQKISITARKPQTTRHRILGINTHDNAQILYVDTPGLHLGGDRAMNRYLNRAASGAISDVDVIVFVVDKLKWTEDDDFVLEKLRQIDVPIIVAINKIDQISNKEVLLTHIKTLTDKHDFKLVIPICAEKGEAVTQLEEEVIKLLPISPPFYPEDQITDRSERFLAAELIREKLIRQLGQELPYRLTVEIEQFKPVKNVLHINALIWVEKAGQKAIVIGKQGAQLKAIGEAARKELEAFFTTKVYLQLWVKVKQGWSNDERALQSLGYRDDV
ncbi:GTPase Era [Kaarinaea lacus]